MPGKVVNFLKFLT